LIFSAYGMKLVEERRLKNHHPIKNMAMKKLMITASILSVLSLNIFAQTATPKISKKQETQQKRIQQGVKSGELTPAETQKLEQEQAKIQHDKKESKADGVVTPEEKAKIHHEQKKAGRHIHHQKHDAQEVPKK